MKRRRGLRRQKPVEGGRTPLPACVIQDLWAHVDAEALQKNASRSWIVAMAVAARYGLKIEQA